MTSASTAPTSHTAESRRANPNHRPALDGIRALAVVSVMLYHGTVGWMRGGFLGVDVFFVLSGYLITGLLLREWQRWGSIDLVGFYVRRARRLLPALVLVVMAVAAWAAFVAASDRLGAIRADGLSTLLYVANWRFIAAQQSYFDQFGDPSPFRHMWSLAIEEQYYLFFPLLLIGLLGLAARRRWVLPAGLATLAVASIVAMAMLYDPAGDPSRVYYGTDTRVHELMIGSLLSVVMVRLSQARRDAAAAWAPYAGVPAVVGVVAAFVLLTDQTDWLYRGGFAVVCLVTAGLVASVELAPRGPVAWLLSLPPVVWVGAVSYGLYLWHWPVYIACTPDRTGLDGTALLAFRIAMTAGLATASYYLVEQPIRSGSLSRLPARLGRMVAALALPVALVALLAGTVGATAPGLPPPVDLPVNAAPDGKHSLLIVGDSVGVSLETTFPGEDYPSWYRQGSAQLGCGLAVQYLAFDGKQGDPNETCDDEFENWRNTVARAKPQAVLLSMGAWEVFDHVVDGRILTATSREYADYLTGRLTEATKILTAGGAHLFIPDLACYGQPSAELQGVDIAGIRNDPDRIAAVNDVLYGFARAHPDQVTVIRVSDWLCPDGVYQDEIDGVRVRYDGVHYSSPKEGGDQGGATAWRQVLMPAIERDASKAPSGSAAMSEPSGSSVRVMLIGDSVPLGLTERFPADDHPNLALHVLSQLGCSGFAVPSVVDGSEQPFQETCLPWQDAIPSKVAEFAPDVAVAFVGIGEQFDKRIDGHVVKFGTAEHDTWLTEQLTARVDLLREAGADVVLPTVPCHDVADTGLSKNAKIINDDDRVRRNNEIIKQVAQSYAGERGPAVRVFDLYDALCADGYADEIDGVTLHEDGLHFSLDGARYVWRLLAQAVRDVHKGSAAG
ncbi:MAG TPA: acyltransferase family protein [Nocardioides sp.]